MQDWVMDILQCPVTHSALQPAPAQLIEQVNRDIAAGSVKTYGGQPVETPLTGGLVNESRSLLYAVVDEIPNLIPDDAIVIGDVPETPGTSDAES